jgi:prepilin-type processing-associated H-X9-DG protein
MSTPPQPPYQQPYYGNVPPPPKKGMPVWGWVLIGCAGIPLLIIPILAAILFPVFAQAREKARQTSCLSNLKQQGLGIMMYAQDYDQTLPPAKAWMDKVGPYIRAERVFQCPSIKQKGTYGYAFNADNSAKSIGKIASPNTMAMVFDCDSDVRSAGVKGLVLPTKARHSGKNNITYADGHAKSVGSN